MRRNSPAWYDLLYPQAPIGTANPSQRPEEPLTMTTAPPVPYRTLLAGYLRPQGLRVAALAGLLLGSITLQLINPQILGRFIDTVSGGGPTGSLAGIAALFLGLAIVQQALSVAATYVSELVGWTATNRLRGDLARHVMRLDLAFHKTR